MPILKLKGVQHSGHPPRVVSENIASYGGVPGERGSFILMTNGIQLRVLETPDEIDAMLGMTDSTIEDRMTLEAIDSIKGAATLARQKARWADETARTENMLRGKTPYHTIAELLEPLVKEGR